MRQPVDAKIDVRESYCRTNWGGGNKTQTQTQTQTNNLFSSFPHKFSRSKGIFFFFWGFTQNIKITKIQLSGEEGKKKLYVTAWESLRL